MTSIVILGDSLSTLCIGHHILDVAPEAEVSIVTERAEIGLIGEVPGLIPVSYTHLTLPTILRV